MIYKKHEIETQYLPGADFTVSEDGVIRNRVPKHIDFVHVTAPDGMRWTEASTLEAKKTIDRYVKLEAS